MFALMLKRADVILIVLATIGFIMLFAWVLTRASEEAIAVGMAQESER